MRDPLVRRDGRWLMTCLNSKRRNTHHPVNGSPGFSFHLRDTELLVTAFPGCRTRFFLPITTCHATASRLSLSLSLSPPLSLSLSLSGSCLLPRPYDRFSAWLVLFFFLSYLFLSYSLVESAVTYFKRLCSTVASGWSDSDAREKPTGAIKRIGSRRCKDRPFPFPSLLFSI